MRNLLLLLFALSANAASPLTIYIWTNQPYYATPAPQATFLLDDQQGGFHQLSWSNTVSLLQSVTMSNNWSVITPNDFSLGSDTLNFQAAVDTATILTSNGCPINVSITRPTPYVLTGPIYLWGTVHITGNAQAFDVFSGPANNFGFGTNIICTTTNAFIQTNFMVGTMIDGLSIQGPGDTHVGTYGIKLGYVPTGLICGQNNIIRDCNVVGFERAVDETGTDNLLIENVFYRNVTNGFYHHAGGTIQACTIRRMSGFRDGDGMIIDGGVWHLEGCDTFKNVADTIGIKVLNGAAVTMANMNVEGGNPAIRVDNVASAWLMSGLYGNGSVLGARITNGSELYIGPESQLTSMGSPDFINVVSDNSSGIDGIKTLRHDIVVTNTAFHKMYRATPFGQDLGSGTALNPQSHLGEVVGFPLQSGLFYDDWIGHAIQGVGATPFSPIWANWDAYSVDVDGLHLINKSGTSVIFSNLTLFAASDFQYGGPQLWGADINANTLTTNSSKNFRIQSWNYGVSNKVGWFEYNSGTTNDAFVELGRSEHGEFATTAGFLGAGTNDNNDTGARLVEWDYVNGFYPVKGGNQNLGLPGNQWSSVTATNVNATNVNTVFLNVTNNAKFNSVNILPSSGGVTVNGGTGFTGIVILSGQRMGVTNGIIMNTNAP